MRVIHVGCGQISRLWLPVLKADPRLQAVAAVDLDRDRANAALADHNLQAPVFGSLTEALATHDADIVFDCTVPEAHLDVTRTALQAGCHVFGEKPMATDFKQAHAAVAAARASGRTYAVMQNRRFDPSIRRVREILSSGEIGDITTINADFLISPHFGGFREQMAHVLILDMAIHTFDAARFLTGADPLSVYCHEWNPENSWFSRDASATAIFEMTKGIVFNYRGSWCAEGRHTSWESHWHIVGTKGSLTWDGDTTLDCRRLAGTGEFINEQEAVPMPALQKTPMASWHAAAIDHFASSVATNSTPETVCTDNIFSLAMALGAADSANESRKIDLRQVMETA